MKVTKISKFHLSLAGEYRVCAEMLKRDIFATVTYGNMKCCDVVAMRPDRRSAVIEVKTSQSKNFVTGFYQKYKTPVDEHPNFWVLYSVKQGADGFDERFFVMTHEEMAEAQAERNRHVDVSWEERARLVAKGVDNVLVENVEKHENGWEKIVRWWSEAV